MPEPKRDVNCSADAGASLVHEGERPWSGQVGGLQLVDAKAGGLDELRDGPVEVASPGETLPDGCQAILPFPHVRIGRPAVFDEKQLPGRFQDPANFEQRRGDIANGTERLGGDDRIDAVTIEWNELGGSLKESQRDA
jgi:hypothetical protein